MTFERGYEAGHQPSASHDWGGSFGVSSLGGYGDRMVFENVDFDSRVSRVDVSGNVAGSQSGESFASRSVEGFAPEALAVNAITGLESHRAAKAFEGADSLIEEELKSRELLGKDEKLDAKNLDGYVASLRSGGGNGVAGKLDDDELESLMERRANAQNQVTKMRNDGGLAHQLRDRVDVSAYGASTLDASVSDGEGKGVASETLKSVRRVEKLSDYHKAKVERKQLSKAVSNLTGEGSKRVELARAAARRMAHAARAAGRALLAAGKALAGVVMAMANPVTWVIAIACLLLAVVISLFSMFLDARDKAIDGVPEMITTEMVMAALDMQEEYGHPAGATIAQIIVESRGSYGGLSGLAYNYKNLFGMKYVSSFEGCEQLADPPYAKMGTMEWEGTGYASTSARFCAFDSYESCIEFRSAVFLQSSTYADNPTLQAGIEQRDSKLYAVGLSDSWATSPTYAEDLIEIIDKYDLTRLDNLSLASFLFEDVNVRGQDYKDANSKQKAVVDMAMRGQLWGVSGGYCQQWVATCYQKALGGSYQSGCCAQGCWLKWGVSSSTDNIPVGAAVYNAGSGSGGGCHSTYGHVGIYVGDGCVVSNAGGMWLKQTLESFQADGWYGWGWNGGVALNSVSAD